MVRRSIQRLSFPSRFSTYHRRNGAGHHAAITLSSKLQPGDIVAHTSDSSALAFAYYAPDIPDHFIAGDPDYEIETTRGRTGRIAGLAPETLESIVANHPRVWVVVALDRNVEYQQARVEEMDARWVRSNTFTVGNIVLLQYVIGG